MPATAIALFLALAWCGPAAADKDTARFTTRTEGASTVITGENASPWMPYHGTVTFPKLVNLRTSVPAPFRFVLPPGAHLDLLALTRIDPGRMTEFRVTYRYGRGDPTAVPDAAAVYLFPWEHGTKHRVDQGYFGPSTHRGMRALDFAMPEGATVCAAREGVVVAARSGSNTGGPSASYENSANFVEVLHADGTWASYAHFQYGGVLVRVGERVAAGTPIGRAGQTGRASGPHLHFAVYRAGWDMESGETVPTVFRHLDGKAVSAAAGKTYYSVHPGGPAFEVWLADRLSDADFEGVTRSITATGTVRVRDDRVDDKVLLWCANGTDEPQRVTVSFDRLKGFVSSKRLPYRRVVPPRTEAYLLSLTHRGGPGTASYEIRYSWRSAKP